MPLLLSDDDTTVGCEMFYSIQADNTACTSFVSPTLLPSTIHLLLTTWLLLGSFGLRRKLLYTPARLLDLIATPDASERPSTDNPNVVASASPAPGSPSNPSSAPTNTPVAATAIEAHPVVAKFVIQKDTELDSKQSANMAVPAAEQVGIVSSTTDASISNATTIGLSTSQIAPLPSTQPEVAISATTTQSKPQNATAKPVIGAVNAATNFIGSRSQPAAVMASPLEANEIKDATSPTFNGPSAGGPGSAVTADDTPHRAEVSEKAAVSIPLLAAPAVALADQGDADTDASIQIADASAAAAPTSVPSTVVAPTTPALPAVTAQPMLPTATAAAVFANPTTTAPPASGASRSWYNSVTVPALDPLESLRKLTDRVAKTPAVLSLNLHAYGKMKAGYSVPLLNNVNFGMSYGCLKRLKVSRLMLRLSL